MTERPTGEAPRTEAENVLREFHREMPGMPTADYAVLPMALLNRIERVLRKAAAAPLIMEGPWGTQTGAAAPPEPPRLDLRERLAALEHEQWEHWSRTVAEAGLTPERIERWERFWVPYADLDEPTKDFDREWADKVLAIVGVAAPEGLSLDVLTGYLVDAENDDVIGPEYRPDKLARYILEAMERDRLSPSSGESDPERPRALNDHEQRCPDCQRVILEEQRDYDAARASSGESDQ